MEEEGGVPECKGTFQLWEMVKKLFNFTGICRTRNIFSSTPKGGGL